MIPKILDIFNLTDEIWGFQLNLLSSVTHINFTWVAWVIRLLSMVIIAWSGNEWWEYVIKYCVLLWFSDNWLLLSQFETWVSSEFMILQMLLKSPPFINIVVSSANNKNCACWEQWIMSLIYIKNSNGPNIDPCGTPIFIPFIDDSALLYVTYCCRWLR